MSKQILVEEQKLGAPVDAYVAAVFALAKLQGVKEALSKVAIGAILKTARRRGPSISYAPGKAM